MVNKCYTACMHVILGCGSYVNDILIHATYLNNSTEKSPGLR